MLIKPLYFLMLLSFFYLNTLACESKTALKTSKRASQGSEGSAKELSYENIKASAQAPFVMSMTKLESSKIANNLLSEGDEVIDAYRIEVESGTDILFEIQNIPKVSPNEAVQFLLFAQETLIKAINQDEGNEEILWTEELAFDSIVVVITPRPILSLSSEAFHSSLTFEALITKSGPKPHELIWELPQGVELKDSSETEAAFKAQEGTYTIRLKLNARGLEATSSISISVDKTSPILTLLTPTEGATVFRPVFSGACEAGLSIKIEGSVHSNQEATIECPPSGNYSFQAPA